MMNSSTGSKISSPSAAQHPQLHLTQREEDDLKAAFRVFSEGKPTINFLDLKVVVETLAKDEGQDKENTCFTYVHNLVERMKDAGDDENSELDEETFIRMIASRNDNNIHQNEYQRVFEMFDQQRKGYINVQDLRMVAEELGESMEEDELEEMIAKAAPNNGKVTQADFEQIMTKRLFN